MEKSTLTNNEKYSLTTKGGGKTNKKVTKEKEEFLTGERDERGELSRCWQRKKASSADGERKN